jgi:GT2 family glycosyltransferase
MDDRGGAGPPQLSVVVPTLGNYAVLRRVLDGFARQDAPADSFELIVVADQADPRPEAVDEAIGDRPYPIRRLIGPRPGASANRNEGWRSARSPIVLFIDNDTIPVPRLVSEHIAWHERLPREEVAILGHVRWAPELRVTPFMRWLDRGIQFDYQSIKGTDASWGQLYTANSSIKLRFIERVGGWDEVRLPYGYEDLDWAYRASRVGLQVAYNRDAIVDHLRTDMTLEFWKRRVRRIASTEREFTRMHPELEPWFHRLFSDAAQRPPARGRGVRLASIVPEWVPWLGPRIWRSADIAWKQALAPHFLEAWAQAGGGSGDQSTAAEFVESTRSSSGSRPGGPK